MATYKRILLKLSGESLMGEKQYGIDEKRLAEYAAQIKEIHELGVQIGIVIGGGNIFRGLSGANKGFDRVKGDQMGMLATVINSLALSSALVAAGVKARVLTAVRMEPIGEFYNKWRAIECMEAGEVVIMSAGTGNPFFTTDTGSSLRGIEIEADVMQNALIYLILSALSYPFLAVYNSCAALFRSMGNSRISMQVSILMNVMNAVGDYVFIFGFHWGVAGAALASLISRMTACVLLYLRLRNPVLDIHAGAHGIHWDGRMIHRILNIGE